MIKTPILIPSYLPDSKLIDLLKELIQKSAEVIIVVRDGGGEEFDYIYEAVKSFKQCHLVIHPINLGKGRAIKSGINYYLSKFKHLNTGVVTADADGQHLAEDIINTARTLQENPNTLILGVRKFGVNVPLRSKIGNIISRYVFSFLLGKKISDTQTGLRGLPHKYLELFIKLNGEKYEYETSMLIALKKYNIAMQEIPIQTVYIENNRTSHFNPLLDSLKIYFLLLRFSFVSFISFILDTFLFFIFVFFFNSIGIASYSARGISLLFNFYLNKNMVFYNQDNLVTVFIKYLLLCSFSITISYLAVSFAVYNLGIKIVLAKIVIEIVLFFINFAVQNQFVFKQKQE